MLLTLKLPLINEHMSTAVIGVIHATEGDAMQPGAKLLDLTVDLSAASVQDCPPVSAYRIALRDRAWLRRVCVARGDEVGVGTTLALFSTTPDEPLDASPIHAARVTIAGIVGEFDLWGARP
ncbi:MAG: hypothetical protein P4L83_18310 [Nevskia sp.]|nr:hypothetical protein [Nevskia sp.]